LDPKLYDIDFICEEMKTVQPVRVNSLFLHDAYTGKLFVKNVNNRENEDFVVSVRV
jgi:hypothetical protein